MIVRTFLISLYSFWLICNFQLLLSCFTIMPVKSSVSNLKRFFIGPTIQWRLSKTCLGNIYYSQSAKCKAYTFSITRNLAYFLLYSFGGTLVGEWCNYVPDIFFFSVTLFFGTFLLASSLKKFKTSNYFPSFVRWDWQHQSNLDLQIIEFQVRGIIADYAVILSILMFVAVDHHFNLETPKLIVPTEFKVLLWNTKASFLAWKFKWFLFSLHGMKIVVGSFPL